MPTAKLTDGERFTLALLLELEEDFPGCLGEMAISLPPSSGLRRFVARLVAPTEDDVAA
jgi:hypothetical protein